VSWYENAIEQAEAASRPGFSGKFEAIQYYQQKYPSQGKGGWKQQLVGGLSTITGMKPKNLEKRFDPQRRANPEKRNAKQYQELALLLGLLKPPPGGYHVHYEGGVQFSDCEEREFDVDITGELAEEVAAHPDRVLDIAMRVYMQQEGEDEASAGACDEHGAPNITITANSDNYRPPARKKHKSATPFMKRK
jgi:hypothetical protein